jgi:hypothetical protein
MAGIEVARGFKMAPAEDTVFDGPYALDAPLIVGDRLGELALDWGLRVEAVHDFFGEGPGPVGVHVFAGEDDDARGEAVAQNAFMLERALPSGVRPEVGLGACGSGGLGVESSLADPL